MNITLIRSARTLLPAALAALTLGAPTAAQAQTGPHNYPTSDRVFFVEACVAQHPGTRFEMISKCSCVLDKIAAKVPFNEFETMSTATNAFSIGGERGNYIRDVEMLTDEIKRFKEVQAAAKKGCFINVEAK
ncbi:MAG: hypothetical protein H0W40_17360 [Methylibium sp.]|uniref:hypothetical protein n=1 Tax=Methylibium sp. TaxID=2067992 RepID=UPI0017EF489D|nr:hypothetical protein [Methylibium sp.]MBA3599121.1 hypothetical protein [Methylibium sp.]